LPNNEIKLPSIPLPAYSGKLRVSLGQTEGVSQT